LAKKKHELRESSFDAVLSRTLDTRRTTGAARTTKGRNTRRRDTKLRLALVFIGLSLAAGLWLTNGYLWRVSPSIGAASHRAAIIDELSLTDSNPFFVKNVTGTLTVSGYSVDYYPPSQVTVELFKTLPSKDYGLIIIRSHNAANAGIITGEQYSQSMYVYEQLTDQLVESELQSRPPYFAIAAGFVRSEMQGQLPDSTIVLMGCAGMQGSPQLAQAFIDKGARFVIGWDSTVTDYGSDVATATLIHGIAQGLTVSQAVGIASNYPDPVTHANLTYLSWQQVSGQRIDNFLYAMESWSTVVFFVVFGPSILFLLPKILGGRWLDLSRRTKNRLELTDTNE
jgi:hypothetical protein